MTLGELIEQLEALRAQLGLECEVQIVHQPNYPLVGSLRGVIGEDTLVGEELQQAFMEQHANMAEAKDAGPTELNQVELNGLVDEHFADKGSLPVVFLVMGQSERYCEYSNVWDALEYPH